MASLVCALGTFSKAEIAEASVPPEIPPFNLYREIESSRQADGPRTDFTVLLARYTTTSAGTESKPQQGIRITPLL